MTVTLIIAGFALDTLALTLGWKGRNIMFKFIKRNAAVVAAVLIGALAAVTVVAWFVHSVSLHMSV